MKKLTIITGTNVERMRKAYRARIDASRQSRRPETIAEMRHGRRLEFNAWPEIVQLPARQGFVGRPGVQVRGFAKRIAAKAKEYPVLVITCSPIFLDEIETLIAAGDITEEDVEILRITAKSERAISSATAAALAME